MQTIQSSPIQLPILSAFLTPFLSIFLSIKSPQSTIQSSRLSPLHSSLKPILDILPKMVSPIHALGNTILNRAPIRIGTTAIRMDKAAGKQKREANQQEICCGIFH